MTAAYPGPGTPAELSVEVTGGLLTAGNLEHNAQAGTGRRFLTLDTTATLAGSYVGENYVGNFFTLFLPDGTASAPGPGSANAIVARDSSQPGLPVVFEVPDPSEGRYELVMTYHDEKAVFTFDIT